MSSWNDWDERSRSLGARLQDTLASCAERVTLREEIESLAVALSPRPEDAFAQVNWQLLACDAHGKLLKAIVLAAAAGQEHLALGAQLSELRRDLAVWAQESARLSPREHKKTNAEDPFVAWNELLDQLLEKWRSALAV